MFDPLPELGRSVSRRGRDDRVAQHLEPLDAALQPIARFDRAHTGRSAGENEIAGSELEQRRQLRDDVRHVPQHPTQVRLLAQLAVDTEPDAPPRYLAQGSRADRGNRRRAVKALASIPRLAALLRGVLQIAQCQIIAYLVANLVIQCSWPADG